MTPNFRQISRECVDRAKKELSTNEDHRVRYAALEIRQAIEAITYDRVEAYKTELDPDVYARWQPRYLLAEIYRVDPDSSEKTSLALEHSSASSHQLGTEVPFTLKNAGRFYDSLSSYLHIPTLKQLQDGNAHNIQRLRKRCLEAVVAFEEVLASTVWNITIGPFSNIDCMRAGCGHKVARRIVDGKEILDAKCRHCRASYHIQITPEGTKWVGDRSWVTCPCGEKNYFWDSDLKPGLRWTCVSCGLFAGTVKLVATVDKTADAARSAGKKGEHYV